MIKGVFKKTLICILIFVIMFNFGITSITQATNTTNTTNSTNTTMSAEEAEALDNESINLFRWNSFGCSQRCDFCGVQWI